MFQKDYHYLDLTYGPRFYENEIVGFTTMQIHPTQPSMLELHAKCQDCRPGYL